MDERTLRRAQRLSALASVPEELQYAQAATQLADHELDVAFAAALRQIEARPPVLSPEAQKISDHLQQSQKQMESDQLQVQQLTASLAQASDAQKGAIQDRLDLTQSQLELDKDEVAAANQDLLEAGGNVHQRIQKMMQDHTSAANSRTSAAKPAADPLSSLHGVAERKVREWLALRKKQRFLQFAAAQAASTAAELSGQRQKLATQLAESKSGALAPGQATPGAAIQPAAMASPAHAATAQTPAGHASSAPAPALQTAGAPPAPPTPSLLTTTRLLAADQKLLTSLDERISDRKQLADVYGKWNEVVASQATTVTHEGLLSLAIVIVICCSWCLSMSGSSGSSGARSSTAARSRPCAASRA